ncbi:M48 family metalloprotease [Streptomyces sp. NBC_00121]|uniref:M48 family metalloprotease n=1 Tax=unclassified Streptomyces TaxID=2593676 RepID=UPI002DD8DE3E|nr:M48 family metalloprotease [Streptomyces sp. NBC_01760]WSC67638.1 M48 family metalloprotease [Streptomyces sp. NBC_01760]
MIYAVWIPLLMPFVAVPAARRLADALSPVRAVRLLASTAVGLALFSTLALVLLVVPGATRLSAVAAVGELVKPLADAAPDVTVPLAAAALALLAGCALAVARAARRHWAELHRAGVPADCSDGELTVVRDSRPDAYALPGLPGSPGRIVVTTGMLRALDPAERDALLAHERAHLVGRHHLFLAAAELAALCHPALRSLRAPMGFALERCADEAAATAVGDRRVAARAIGRAALAARAAEGAESRPRVALAATAGPVPRRVEALLGRATPRPRVGRAAAAALLACLVLSGAAALDATHDLHSSIEVAQGESPQY